MGDSSVADNTEASVTSMANNAGYRCQVCNKSFSGASKLRQHMEMVHGPNRECNVSSGDVLRAARAIGEGSAIAQASSPAVLSARARANTAAEDPEVDGFASAMAQARVVNHVPRDTVQVFKKVVSDMIDKLHKDVLRLLSPLLAEGVDAERAVGEAFRSVRQSFQRVAGRDKELDHLRAHPAYVKPRERYLGSYLGGTSDNPEVEKFYAYDSPLKETLEAMFATNPDVWEQVQSFTSRVEQRLRTSDAFDDSARITDMIDGTEFAAFYLRLNKKMQPDETPLVFILYYDGLEVVNGLGQARLSHELACFYWALVPISDMVKRLEPQHLRLATVCLKRAVTHVGMDVVINGRPEDGDDNTSWGAQMQRARMELSTPLGKRMFRVGTAVVAADTPAGAELFGVKKAVGPSTKSCCKGCHCLQHGDPPPYRQPNSFLSTCHGWKRHCAGRQQAFVLRSVKDFQKYLQKLQAVQSGTLSEADLEAWKQEMGVNDFLSALWRCPCLSLTAGCPMDMMHVLLEGVARNLLGAVAFVMIRRWGIDQDDLITAMADFAKASKYKRARYPYVNSSRVQRLREGGPTGKCKGDADFPGTAMQVIGATGLPWRGPCDSMA